MNADILRMNSDLPKVPTRVGSRRPRAQDIDRHIGARLRLGRIMRGLTQQALADLIGVTYQQAHKYENGRNRVSAGRLYAIARVLGVDMGYFFEGLEGDPTSEPTPQQRVFLDLARNFRSIRTGKHQVVICRLTRILANLENAPNVIPWPTSNPPKAPDMSDYAAGRSV
jgi:transcriptional regulator with XRE-family HTH domain